MKRFIISLILVLASFLQVAEAQKAKSETTKSLTGYVKFYFELNTNLQYPAASEAKNTIGMSVSRVVLSQEGKVESVEIINPLDKDIDYAVVAALKKTSLVWLLSDSSVSDRTFYIQIAFILNLGPSDFFFKSAVPNKKMFVKPVAIYGFPESPGMSQIPEQDFVLTADCNLEYQSGNYTKALKIADELIRRYPYTKDLYQLRILIAKKLFRNDIIQGDVLKMSNFAEGMSLDKLMSEE